MERKHDDHPATLLIGPAFLLIALIMKIYSATYDKGFAAGVESANAEIAALRAEVQALKEKP